MQAENPQSDTSNTDPIGTAPTKPPTSFYVIAVLAVLWNGLGVAAYLMQVTGSPQDIGQTPEQVAFYEQMPGWVISAFAVAVFSGIAASVLLLLRNNQAIPLFSLSLVAVLVQNLWTFTAGNGLAVFGAAGAVLPALVIVITIALLGYSRAALRRGWVK